MLKRINPSILERVRGGECYCCCWRNPSVRSREGVLIGTTKNEQKCANRCNNNFKLYKGFMSCATDFNLVNCSALSNIKLAEEILYHRRVFGEAWSEIDVIKLSKG